MREPQPQYPPNLQAALDAFLSDPGVQQPQQEQGYQALTEQMMRSEVGASNPAETFAAHAEKKPRKRKSNKSEFFALLRRIDAEEKDGKKDTRKALKQLAKQLSDADSVATKGNATGKIEV